MHHVRRRRIVVVALLCATILAGCNSAPSSPTSGAGNPGSSPPRIVYSGAQNADAYLAIACGIRVHAAELGVTVDVQSPPEFTAAAQTPVINAAVAGKPDGLIVSPADAKAMSAPLASARAAGVPVITALNTLSNPDPLTGQVLADEDAGGKRAAQLVAEHLAGRPGKVALLAFTPGRSVPSDKRRQSFEQEIPRYPNITYRGAEIVGLDPQESTAKMNAILAREPDINAVVATFGRSGDGAATAIRQRGSTNTFLVTYDTNSGTVEALRRGEINALIDYNLPYMGRLALDRVLAAHNGRPYEPLTSLPPTVYTVANINDPANAPALQATPCPR